MIGHVEKEFYGIYAKYKINDVRLENGTIYKNVDIYRFKYGWLPLEIMLETIENLEDQEDKIYMLYRKHGKKPNEYFKRIGERNMTFAELREELRLLSLLS